MMLKRSIVTVYVVLFFLISPKVVFAESSYVLPYPSFMPGTLLYKIDTVMQPFESYWYFGDFGQFTYSLKESDKYLVQAKTLFEYKQYLLAMNALQKSDDYFQKIQTSLINAKKNGKDISDEELLLIEAAKKHKEVLQSLLQITPQSFNWTPEKTAASMLSIHDALRNSIQIRQHR